MSFTCGSLCSLLYGSLLFILRIACNILFVNLIYETARTDLTLICFFIFVFSCLFFLNDLFFFFLHSYGTCFFFLLQFFPGLHITRFRIVHIFLNIIRLFLPEFCDHIQDDQEQYDQTKNDQAFNTFCSHHKISHIANGNYNFWNIISNLNGKSLSSGNGLICYCSGSLGGIEIGDRIFICLGIFLYKDRSTCADRRTLLRDRICNRSDWEVRCLIGFIHDHCSHPEERRKNKSQYTDQCAYHNKMYDKFQYF